MIVLAAIGRFFKKIWDWIKQTAWIQPLLIVGIIFGVIFSIPSIVKGVKAGKDKKNKYEAYYHDFQISLELTEEKGTTSKADLFTDALGKVMNGDDGAEAAFKKSYSDLGDKFFVAYVATDCEKCKEAKDGFELFQDSLNKDKAFVSETGTDEKFHMVTIFTDEETSETDEDETAFVKYLNRHQKFFADAGEVAGQTDYYTKGNLVASDIEALETADPIDFLTPTIFLVELGDKAVKFNPGISEVMFGVDGSDKNAKAKTLLDCWNHTGSFSIND